MRKIVCEARFDEELGSLAVGFRRADELIAGVKWVPARNPEFGTRISVRDDIWVVPSIDVFEQPLVIYYTFNDTHVYLLSIQPADRGECDPAG